MTAADEPGNSFYPYRLAAHHGSNGTRVRFVYRCRDLTCFDQISGLFRLQAMRAVLPKYCSTPTCIYRRCGRLKSLSLWNMTG